MSSYISFKDSIVFENEHIIAVNKQAGLSSLNERNINEKSLVDAAKNYFPASQLCHRLDKETTGILLIAKDPETYREMAILFEKREVTKIYHAVVIGQLSVENKSILLPLGVTKNGIAKVDLKEGKNAETVISTLELFKHYTLLECKPVTGRLHQIRIHLASQHFPICSDATYGGRIPMLSYLKKDFKVSKWENEKGMIQRVALHARTLKFTLYDKENELTAPYPKDFEVLLKLLQKHDI